MDEVLLRGRDQDELVAAGIAPERYRVESNSSRDQAIEMFCRELTDIDTQHAVAQEDAQTRAITAGKMAAQAALAVAAVSFPTTTSVTPRYHLLSNAYAATGSRHTADPYGGLTRPRGPHATPYTARA